MPPERTPVHPVQAKLLGNPGYLICRQHDSQSQEHIVLKGHHSQKQKRGLHECCQADCHRLLAPLVETIRITSGHAEHIQAPHRNLHQHDPASFDIGKEHFDNAVGKGNQEEEHLQANLNCSIHEEEVAQDEVCQSSDGRGVGTCKDTRQISGEYSLKGTAELIQLHRKNTHQGCRKETFQHIQRRPLDIHPAGLALHGHFKNSHNHTCSKQRPSQECEQIHNCLHPAQIKYFNAQVVDFREQFAHRCVDGFIEPLHHGIPYGGHDIGANVLKGTAKGISQTRQDIP